MADLHRAQTFLEMGRPREALSAAAAILAHHPDDVEALIIAAQCHRQLLEPNTALTYAKKALNLDPEHQGALFAAALSYADLRNVERASWHATRIISAAPELWAGYLALAAAYVNDEDHGDEARRAAAKAIELAPFEPDTHLLAAQVEMYARRRRPDRATRERARQHLKQALRLDPENRRAKHELAMLSALGWGFHYGLRESVRNLKSMPLDQAPLGSIAYVFRRLIGVAHLTALAAFLGCLTSVLLGSALGAQVVATTAAAAMAAIAVVIGHQLGRSAWAHLRAFPRRDRSGTQWVACLILAVALLNVAAWITAPLSLTILAGFLVVLGGRFAAVPVRYDT